MTNLLSPSFLIASMTTACLGVWVVIKNPRNKIYLSWFLFCLSVALWSFGLGILTSVKDIKIANIFYFIHYIGAIFIPISFLYFINVYFLAIRRMTIHLSIGVLLAVFQLGLFVHGMLVAPLTPKWNFYFYTNPGSYYGLFVLYFFYYVLLCFINMAKATWRSKKEDKQRNIFFIVATGVGFMGGCSAFLLVYDVRIPPYGIYLFLAFPIITTYAIVRHRLLDIEVIIRRTVVFAGLLTFVFGVFSGAALLVRKLLAAYLGGRDSWTYVISLFFIVLGYDPIRNLLINLTDRYLFQKGYDYQKLLKDASKGMSRIESLDHLIKLVVHFITMRMRVKNAAVLTRQIDADEFILYHQRGYAKNFLEYRVSTESPLIQYLASEKEAVDLDKMKEMIEFGTGRKTAKAVKLREYDYAAIRSQMEELGVVCCVPSFLGHELRNVLIMGDKKSGDLYTEEDLNVLFTLAQESAIAIENARLYDEAVSKTHELEKINQQLEYSKGLLMKALKETEIANKQLQDTQAQLIHEQKMATLGRLAASVGHEVNNPLTILSMNVSRAILKYRKNPDVRLAEVLDLFDKMEQNIGRIKAVVNTLTGLLKRSEKGKFEPLSLKLILEETLPLVQFQTYLDNLSGTEVEFDVPAHLPLIRGDLERLQEVFLNLFINAYHAMEGRRDRRIHVTTEINPANPLQVTVNFADNGSGMSEEVMKKVFTYGFTTKPPGRGSGMGLYMCKYIIELHGGEMRVQSKLGEGTTFTLTLPVFEESGMSGFSEGKATASH